MNEPTKPKMEDLPTGKRSKAGTDAVVMEVQAQKLRNLLLDDVTDDLSVHLAVKAARECRLSAQRIERALKPFKKTPWGSDA